MSLSILWFTFFCSATVKFLLKHTEFHLMPTLNPDGYSRSRPNQLDVPHCVHKSEGRRNANGVDLNRSFPDIWDKRFNKTNKPDPEIPELQPEIRAMMKWVLEENFVLSANFHGGAVVASYPYDSVNPSLVTDEVLRNQGTPILQGIKSLSPDMKMYELLASTYAKNNQPMNLQNELERCIQGTGGPFRGGITNGADWYNVPGSMQDFVYHFTNSMAITLEISCCKHPHHQELAKVGHTMTPSSKVSSL